MFRYHFSASGWRGTARGVASLTDQIVVCNLTGHGLKQPEAIKLSEKKFAPIAPTLQTLREQLAKF